MRRLVFLVALYLSGCSPSDAPHQDFPSRAPKIVPDPARQKTEIVKSIVNFRLSTQGEAPEGGYIVVLTPTLRICDLPEGEDFGGPGCLPRLVLNAVNSLELQPLAPSELRAAFKEANKQSEELTISPSDTARLVPSKEVERIFEGQGWWDDFYKQYPRSAGYLKLSSPGFSRDGSEALVYAEHGCGGLCGTGWLLHLSRNASGWSITSRRMLWVS